MSCIANKFLVSVLSFFSRKTRCGTRAAPGVAGEEIASGTTVTSETRRGRVEIKVEY